MKSKDNLSLGVEDFQGNTNLEKSISNMDDLNPGYDYLEKAKAAPIGTINNYNEIKTADGWKWITKEMQSQLDSKKGGTETKSGNSHSDEFKDYTDQELSQLINNLSNPTKEVSKDDEKLNRAKIAFSSRVQDKKGTISTDDKHKVSESSPQETKVSSGEVQEAIDRVGKYFGDVKSGKRTYSGDAIEVLRNVAKEKGRAAGFTNQELDKMITQSREKHEKGAEGSTIKDGDTVTLNSDVHLTSFSKLEGENLTVSKIKSHEFASGAKKYAVIQSKGKEYEVPVEFLTKTKSTPDSDSKSSPQETKVIAGEPHYWNEELKQWKPESYKFEETKEVTPASISKELEEKKGKEKKAASTNRLLKQANLSSAEYQKAKKLSGFNDKDYKWNSDKGLYEKKQEEVSDAKKMSEGDIRQAMAESGKTTQKDLLAYMKAKYSGKYDLSVAKDNAKELAKEMKGYM